MQRDDEDVDTAHSAHNPILLLQSKQTSTSISNIMADTVVKPQPMPYATTPPANAPSAPFALQVDSGAYVASGMADANGLRVGAWDAGFCDCFTHMMPNCLMATCVPCVSLAQITSRLGLYTYSKALVFFLGVWTLSAVLEAIDYATGRGYYYSYYYYYDGYYNHNHSGYYNSYNFSVWSGLSTACSLLFIVGIWQLRTKTRERFNIPGSCLGDCCASFWCSCCTIAQMATHVKSYQPGTCDFGPVDTLPAFQ